MISDELVSRLGECRPSERWRATDVDVPEGRGAPAVVQAVVALRDEVLRNNFFGWGSAVLLVNIQSDTENASLPDSGANSYPPDPSAV